MQIDRDPRVDPKPGDIVHIGSTTRKVVANLSCGCVAFDEERGPNDCESTSLPLPVWKNIHADAEIVKCSDV